MPKKFKKPIVESYAQQSKIVSYQGYRERCITEGLQPKSKQNFISDLQKSKEFLFTPINENEYAVKESGIGQGQMEAGDTGENPYYDVGFVSSMEQETLNKIRSTIEQLSYVYLDTMQDDETDRDREAANEIAIGILDRIKTTFTDGQWPN